MPFSENRKILSKVTIHIENYQTWKNICPERPSKHVHPAKKNKFKLPQENKASYILNLKRVFVFAFQKPAYVSVEAAICLSIFLIALMSVLSFGTVMNRKMKIDVALRNTASKIAQDYAVYDVFASDEEGMLKNLAIRGIGVVAAREMFIDELVKENLDNSCICGGSSGINFFYSDILDEEGYVDIVIAYTMKLPFKLFPMSDIKMTQRSRIHPWTGVVVYEDTQTDEKYVYVTKTGTVYHLSLSCKYLNIKVSKVSVNELNLLRNETGGKYYPCKICYKDNSGSVVYITKSGTAYHGEKDCPSLTRDVRKVKISECIGMPACSSCGG